MIYSVKRFSSTFEQRNFFFAHDGSEFTLQQAENATNLKGAAAVRTYKIDQAATNAGNDAARTVTRTVNKSQHQQYVDAAKAKDYTRLSNLNANAAKQGEAVKSIASDAYKKGLSAGQSSGFNQGRRVGKELGKELGKDIGAKSTGIWGGMKNTWNNGKWMGAKGAMVGGGLLAAGLMAKGLFGGRKKKED